MHTSVTHPHTKGRKKDAERERESAVREREKEPVSLLIERKSRKSNHHKPLKPDTASILTHPNINILSLTHIHTHTQREER